jgi:hypothetical protein
MVIFYRIFTHYYLRNININENIVSRCITFIQLYICKKNKIQIIAYFTRAEPFF